MVFFSGEWYYFVPLIFNFNYAVVDRDFDRNALEDTLTNVQYQIINTAQPHVYPSEDAYSIEIGSYSNDYD